jgi:hypothetical protein
VGGTCRWRYGPDVGGSDCGKLGLLSIGPKLFYPVHIYIYGVEIRISNILFIHLKVEILITKLVNKKKHIRYLIIKMILFTIVRDLEGAKAKKRVRKVSSKKD